MASTLHLCPALLALSLISSLADLHTCQQASTRQRLNAMDGPALVQGVRRDPPSEIFASVDLTPQQIASIGAGRPVAKVLSWGTPSEVFLFGAVHVDASPDAYLAMARDLHRLKSTEGFVAVGEVTERTTAAALSDLTLDADDFKGLKNCREGSCDVQLAAASIAGFHDAALCSDAADQVNALTRATLLKTIQAYRQTGNAALGEYRDKKVPVRVDERFAAMIEHASPFMNAVPELRRYLLEYPNAPLAGADSFLYWEKVAFGLKPTLRVNHTVISRNAVAIKQLYASHYFHTALDISICVDDAAATRTHGFSLITLKSSEQDGLTGVNGSMLRNRATDRARSSLERALASIKQTLEQSARR